VLNCLVFDIETVPDVDSGRRLLSLDGLSDEDVAKAMTFKHLQDSGSEFLPLYQHRIVAISVVLRMGDSLKVWSLGDVDSSEAELVQRFYDGLETYRPDLVSWNGGGFDLPVLHYRALLHGVQSPRYWEIGDEDRNFRYNNYLSRFHWRHIDVMDVLSGFQPRARAGLDAIAVMLGYPGKMGMKGDQVWPSFLNGEIEKIRNYCETDVLNTYLVYLRFQFMRGILDARLLELELDRVRALLGESSAEHLQSFLMQWTAGTESGESVQA
jgi:predicted PolB exonuclease-like 3'-5' exonuclease